MTNNALEYLQSEISDILDEMETGEYDGNTPHDMAQMFDGLLAEARRLPSDDYKERYDDAMELLTALFGFMTTLRISDLVRHEKFRQRYEKLRDR